MSEGIGALLLVNEDEGSIYVPYISATDDRDSESIVRAEIAEMT